MRSWQTSADIFVFAHHPRVWKMTTNFVRYRVHLTREHHQDITHRHNQQKHHNYRTATVPSILHPTISWLQMFYNIVQFSITDGLAAKTNSTTRALVLLLEIMERVKSAGVFPASHSVICVVPLFTFPPSGFFILVIHKQSEVI